MKIYYHCYHCNPKTKVEIGRKCDTCEAKSSSILSIELRIDDTDYDFCSSKCLKKFVDAELKKEKNNV